MKNTALIFVILLFLSCDDKTEKNTEIRKSFTLSGIINGNYSDYIYLNYGTVKDSAKVLNNSFEFKGVVDKPISGSLNLKPYANIVPLYIENSEISIQGDYQELFQNGKDYNILNITDIKGSYTAKIQEEYKVFYQANQNKENFQTLLYSKLKSFIEINKSHPFSGAILGENALIEPILSKRELIELYSKIDTSQQHKEDLEMFKMGIANLDKYGKNKQFLEFSLPNTEDKNIEIKSFLGKTTLIDFWASWCGPCRIKHPKMIMLKEKFEHTDFDIVSVSIDDNINSWIKAIEKDNLDWTNLIDIDKKINDELEIPAIPFNYLIDKKGIVLGVNLSLEQIENELNKANR